MLNKQKFINKLNNFAKLVKIINWYKIYKNTIILIKNKMSMQPIYLTGHSRPVLKI